MYFLGFPVYRMDPTHSSVSKCHQIGLVAFLLPHPNFLFQIATFCVSVSIYFLYHQVTAVKDPDAAFFKKLDGFQPCEITELKAGNHYFAVYGTTFLCKFVCAYFNWKRLIWLHFVLRYLSSGDNFFKSVSYTIEVLSAAPFSEEKECLRSVEAQILTKRVELSKFETEYREVCDI